VLLLTAVAALASPGDSTNGHGTFTTGGSTVVSFVFDAKETGSSAITGRARFFDNGALSLDILVDCLTISGNTAIIGGTDVANPSTTYAFKVTDNGGGATADRITLPQVNQTCATFNALSSFALTSGDLEVHDQP
jgi:hypothetical protein